MTNTKPTWEDEFRELYHYSNYEVCIALIQKVEQEAYERGKSDGQEEEAILWRQSHL